MKKETIIHIVKDFAVITFGAALAAAAIFFFMLPSNVAVGSASALAMVLSNFIPLPVSALNLAINVILLIIGFILIGSEFGAKTVYTSIMVPGFMGVFEWIFPNFQSLTGDPFLDVLCYILVVGMATAIPEKETAFPRSIFKYLLMILATMSSPPDEAFLENRIAIAIPTTSM